MGKYINAWSYKKTDHHDCANDGTCGQSITDFRIGNSDISFYDNYGRTITQIPKLPNGSSITYYNNLYKTAQSRNFDENTKYAGLQDVLPNQFNYRCKDLDFTINFDSLSQREQDQVKMDIQSAYDAYKAKFCIDRPGAVQIYIFNNKDDYRKYGALIPRFAGHQSMIDNSGGMASEESLMCYKSAYMDNVLAHELGHVFQFKFSPTKVRELDQVNSQLMANAIGLEVEEKNYKAICKQMSVDEYNDRGWMFQFKYKGTNYDIQHNGYLSAEEEKLQFIKDIKNSHESLINEGQLSQNTTVVISIDENKEISQMYFHNPDKNMSDWLDKILISRSKPEQDVDEVDHTEGKEPEEDTQQPSNFLSNIFSAIKSIIDSISSFFSWLFGSKEEEQSDDNLSLLNLSEEQSDDNLSLLKPDVDKLGHDVRDHLSDHYHSPDEFM
ncbi:hypothetical protein [Wolbachia endosymbiont (group A) of Bibio marci]|uniref:hypothetical protein n=1 Tax=Wolbachia endosymbiont (group A) of Bibio marci TaxID=2953987 RepID=UPI00223113BC|nr:hypothetical protein [Wolbachia endosymbiont (group A) of Bibio marci]